MTNIENKKNLFNNYTDEIKIDEYSSLASIILSPADICNRKCSFCPHGHSYKPKTPFMSLSILEAVKKQATPKFKGVYSLSGFGEPTLNPYLDKYINSLMQTGNDVVLYTNGDNFKVLKEVKPTRIEISLYSKDRYIFYKKHIKEIGSPVFLKKQYEKNNTFFNNRAGSIFETDNIPETCCNIAMMKISIDTDGNIIQCCSDWKRKTIMGNIMTDDLWDIWINKMRHERELLLSGRRKDTTICSKCTSPGNLYGNQFKEFWETYYAEHR